MVLQFTTISFVIIMLILFQLLKGDKRKVLLFSGSMLYIFVEGGITGIVSVILITLVTWKTGVMFFSESVSFSDKERKRAATAVIIAISLILFGWKYIPWHLQRLGVEGIAGNALLAMPIGLSFYSFQAISYIADLYSGKCLPEKSFTNFGLYMTWFPKWMSGPIERAGKFIGQFEFLPDIRAYSFRRITTAAPYIVWGLVMKLMIADKAAKVVDTVFSSPGSFGTATLAIGSILYTIQIYCDFAGYTNMVLGISKLFGLDLTQNFRTPYMAENIIDFRRRWHISLSNFLRDYIYIPLGGNRKGFIRKHLNTALVFLVCGMWHGAGLSFVVWGMIHALFNIVTSYLRKSPLVFLTKGTAGRVLTFCAVSFAWIFFRADSLTYAGRFITGMVPVLNSNPLFEGIVLKDGLMLGMSTMDWWIVGISVVILVAADIISYRKDSIPPELMVDSMGDNRRLVFLSVILALVLVFGEYGAGEEIRKFVYMNF